MLPSAEVMKKMEGQMDAPSQLFLKVRFLIAFYSTLRCQSPASTCSSVLFFNAQVKDVDQSGEWFKDGMKLEAIDPLNLSAICVATVRKVKFCLFSLIECIYMHILNPIMIKPTMYMFM